MHLHIVFVLLYVLWVCHSVSDCPFHGQKFQLHAAVQGAVLFSWPEASTGIGYDTLLPILFLGQDGTEPVMTCICLHDEGFGVVGTGADVKACFMDSNAA